MERNEHVHDHLDTVYANTRLFEQTSNLKMIQQQLLGIVTFRPPTNMHVSL